jgi:hypothetical protein
VRFPTPTFNIFSCGLQHNPLTSRNVAHLYDTLFYEQIPWCRAPIRAVSFDLSPQEQKRGKQLPSSHDVFLPPRTATCLSPWQRRTKTTFSRNLPNFIYTNLFSFFVSSTHHIPNPTTHSSTRPQGRIPRSRDQANSKSPVIVFLTFMILNYYYYSIFGPLFSIQLPTIYSIIPGTDVSSLTSQRPVSHFQRFICTTPRGFYYLLFLGVSFSLSPFFSQAQKGGEINSG